MELFFSVFAVVVGWGLCGIAVMFATKALLGYDTSEVDGMDFLPIVFWPLFLVVVLTIGFAKLVVYCIESIHYGAR